MKRLFLFFSFLLITLFANAQTEKTIWNYQLDNIKTEVFQVANQAKTIKLKTQNVYGFRNIDYFLGLTLKKAIEEGKITVYKDKKCRKSMSIEEVKAVMFYTFIDTVMAFSPFTFEEYPKIVETKIARFPIKETIYEFEQKWDFDNKSSNSIMTLDAIHISHYELIDTDKQTKKHHLFSIKVEDLNLLMDSSSLENPSIIWARYIEYEGVFENDKIKNKLFSPSYLIDNKVVSGIFENYPFIENQLLTKEEIRIIGVSIDTIITYDPETFKENRKVIRNELNLDDITTFKTAQEIYFDTENNRFRNRLLAIAPIRSVYDENGNYKYKSPMFWIVYDDDFLKWLD